MTKNLALRLEDVSKSFSYREIKNDSIREKVLGIIRGTTSKKKIEVLKDVNLEVEKGQFVGIIGRNGSGKSTLLKLIIGAIKADKGSIKSYGKIIRLALGLGFDPNLNAEDNVYVNGSILGLTFRQIGQRFHDIISFAELEEFVNTPIKYYSSGMHTRLAFAVAMHVDTDILLIDEFFGGVGDEGFKKKSEAIFKKTFLDGRTIVFVSHNLDLIREYSDKVAILNNGHLSNLYNPDEAIKIYKDLFAA